MNVKSIIKDAATLAEIAWCYQGEKQLNSHAKGQRLSAVCLVWRIDLSGQDSAQACIGGWHSREGVSPGRQSQVALPELPYSLMFEPCLDLLMVRFYRLYVYSCKKSISHSLR